MEKRPNIILIISDTLRTAYLGCYGNKKIKTPNIDAFAKESSVFENAYPESLPTIPVRRAMHTGRRSFPFRDYKPLKWDVVALPGWQPMSNDEDTLAENLAAAGYHTGFVTDTIPYFSPGFTFTRGFWQWEFIRGKEMDRWRSLNAVPASLLKKYGDPEEIKKKGGDREIAQKIARSGVPDETLVSSMAHNLILRHTANTMGIKSEKDTTTAKVFKWAQDFINDNKNAGPFYLMIDCFDPHEPWEAPEKYLELYADPDYKGKTDIFPDYGPMGSNMKTGDIENIVANYSGLVTLLDTCFGRFINDLKRQGMWEDSAVIFMSDHGTNFGDNTERILGKPAYSMFPGLMNIPMIVNLPGKGQNGSKFRDPIYNIDATATIYELTGAGNKNLSLEGRSLVPLIQNNKWAGREYLTSRYGNNLWYRDDKYWIITDIDKKPYAVFDLEDDPLCKINLVGTAGRTAVEKAWRAILEDSGGSVPDYRKMKQTDAIGR